MKVYKNTLYLKVIPFFYLKFVILFLLSSCQTIDSDARPDLTSHIQKPTVLILTNPPKNLKNVWPKIVKDIEKKLSEMKYLGKLIGQNDLRKKFLNNPKFRSKLSTFTNTLSLTGISDKEIALKVEKELNIQYFLFFEFLSFPCTNECSSNQQWIIRLKLIESKSGDFIFWVRKKFEVPQNLKDEEDLNNLANNLSLEVVNEFASRFIIPWHIWRYNHLKTYSNLVNNSKF